MTNIGTAGSFYRHDANAVHNDAFAVVAAGELLCYDGMSNNTHYGPWVIGSGWDIFNTLI